MWLLFFLLCFKQISFTYNTSWCIKLEKLFRNENRKSNKRLIVRDAQGLRGKKIEIYSLPYSSINMQSTENAGNFDINAKVELWTRAGNIKIGLGKDIDSRKFDDLIVSILL